MRCENLRPLQGSSTGYRLRGDRCEGVYVSLVGSQSLSAMSFTIGPIRYDLKSAAPLEVTAPGQTEAVNVRATAIPLKTYYRMNAVLAPHGVLTWPVTDVLAPEGLVDGRVGVMGWKGTPQNQVLVPIRVATKGGAAPRAVKPLLVIQASFDAQLVKWRWGPLRAGQCAALGPWQSAIASPVAAGWPIVIDLSALPSGTHCFEVAAQSGVSTEWSALKLRIDIPPQ